MENRSTTWYRLDSGLMMACLFAIIFGLVFVLSPTVF